MRQAAVAHVIKPCPAVLCSIDLNNARLEMCSGFVVPKSKINCTLHAAAEFAWIAATISQE